MTTSKKRLLPALVILVLMACAPAKDPADTVYINGKIYTQDDLQPWAEAVAIKGKRLAFVGDSGGVEEYVGDGTNVIDLQGKFVMPGIHDAHTHFLMAGLQAKASCDLPANATPKEMVVAIRACGAGQDPKDWIVAGFFYANQFPDNKPNKAFLDAAFPDTPIYLKEFSAHHGLVNTKALEIAGINHETSDPMGGRLPKDAIGALTGELVESAIWLVLQHIPGQSDEVNQAAIRWASQKSSEFGITSVQEAAATKAALAGMKVVDGEGGLNQRVAAHLILKSSMFGGASPEELEALLAQRQNYSSPRVAVDYVKMWLDGSPTPPYFTEAGFNDDKKVVDETNLLVDTNDLNATVARLDKQGVKVKMHVAGAGAAHQALDAIEYARTANPDSKILHELGHTNLVIPSDHQRFSKLNAVAEMSPTVWHLYGHTLGNPPRPAWQFRSLRDKGALLTVGTDWPVTTDPNLFPALEGMLDRDDESIELEDALAAMTINGATAVGWDEELGSITMGKMASLIVLDRNLFDVAVSEISETKVLTTVFEGREVYTLTAE